MLANDLDYYEKLIDPASFKTRMANVKNKTWYSKKMSLDTLYNLHSLRCKHFAGLEDLRIREEKATRLGIPWTEEERKRLHDDMFAAQLKEWSSKSSKLAALLNPEYGNFLSKCAEMHEYCEKEKRDGRQSLGCGLDRARLFMAVSSLDPTL